MLGEQGGEQSLAAGVGKHKWKAIAYHSHLIDFYIILQKKISTAEGK